jgi:cobalamin 5'-phosphate synthase/cobalamin synthase
MSARRIAGDLALAFAALTRLPVPGLGRLRVDEDRLRAAAVWYPLVGFVLGLMTLAAVIVIGWLGWGPELVAALVLVIGYALNGFLHFDGFCDCCDALLAPRTPAERLAILRDSHHGSFALGGGGLLLLVKWLALASVCTAARSPVGLAGLILVPAMARGAILATAWRAHYPRPDGAAAFLVGRFPGRRLAAAALVLLVGTVIWILSIPWKTMGFDGLWQRPDPVGLLITPAVLLVTALTVAVLLRIYATRRIGGVTGDVLGATVEVSETAMLLSLVVLMR